MRFVIEITQLFYLDREQNALIGIWGENECFFSVKNKNDFFYRVVDVNRFQCWHQGFHNTRRTLYVKDVESNNRNLNLKDTKSILMFKLVSFNPSKSCTDEERVSSTSV